MRVIIPLFAALFLLRGLPGVGAEPGPNPPALLSVAVVDLFPAEEKADYAWLGLGFTETFADRLQTLRQVHVLPTAEVRETLKDSGVLPELTASVQHLGQVLRVDYVISGTVQKQEREVLLKVRLVRVRDGWAGKERELRDDWDRLFEMQAALIYSLAQEMGLRLTPEEEERIAGPPPTQSLVAFEYYARGWACYQPEDPHEAWRVWEQALKIDPDFVQVREAIARATHRYQQILQQRVLDQYREALQRAPHLASLHYHLGVAYFDQGQFLMALQEFQEAQRLQPNHLEALYYQGTTLLTGLRRYADAIHVFEQLLQLKGDHLNALNNLGVAYFRSGRSQEAVRCWEQVLKLDPANPFARDNLERLGRSVTP